MTVRESLRWSDLRAKGAEWRPWGAGAVAVLTGSTLLAIWPALELELFGRGTARLAAVFSGASVVRVAEGWWLAGLSRDVMVSAACSATSFFLMLAALLAWHLARRGLGGWQAGVAGLAFATPLAIAVNALRVVTVIQAHRWVIPHLPETYAHFLHLLTGVAVFLPTLIFLNLLLESHGRRHAPVTR